MTANRRIILNVLATYGRSVYALVLGLFSARWVLMTLGEVDYGLFGLIGSMVSFVAFINGILGGSVGRFYAFAVGQAKTNLDNGLEECRRWFNIALTIHTVLPVVLVCIGYPIGIWAIENFLTIPPERIVACIWVWRFSCISCFVSMVSVPFNAMYTAKQEIAELTLYSVAATTINFGFLCYMISHPGDWFVRYSAWACFICILPNTVIVARAVAVYKECRFCKSYLWDTKRIVALFSFAASSFLCTLSLMIQGQGRAILVNKYLGPAKNAAMTIGQNLTTHASTLTSAMVGAFMPAVTNAYGAGDYDLARKLCFRICKFGTLSILMFAAPLIAESENVLTIWLKTPPEGAALLCSLLLIELCIIKIVDGHWMIVIATGKIARFNFAECFGCFFAFALMWVFMLMGFGLASIGLGVIAGTFYAIPVKLYFARRLGGLSVRYWVIKVAIPIGVVSVASIITGLLVRCSFTPTFWRVVLTTIMCEVLIFSLSWLIVFDEAEKRIIAQKANAIKGKLLRTSNCVKE